MIYKFSFFSLLPIIILTKLQGQSKAKYDPTIVTVITINIKQKIKMKQKLERNKINLQNLSSLLPMVIQTNWCSTQQKTKWDMITATATMIITKQDLIEVGDK